MSNPFNLTSRIGNRSNRPIARPRIARHCGLAALLLVTSVLAGCNILNYGAQAIPTITKAKYKGLVGQSVGVMVWADRGTLIDWQSIQLDLAATVQNQLQSSDADDLKGATYPWKPESIVRYQRDHPGLEALSVSQIAPKIGVTRLIYVEIESFATRSTSSAATLELYRGSATASLRVVEVANGVGKIAYEENGITVTFPKNVPQDGTPRGSDNAIYAGTLRALGTEILHRFADHMDE